MAVAPSRPSKVSLAGMNALSEVDAVAIVCRERKGEDWRRWTDEEGRVDPGGPMSSWLGGKTTALRSFSPQPAYVSSSRSQSGHPRLLRPLPLCRPSLGLRPRPRASSAHALPRPIAHSQPAPTPTLRLASCHPRSPNHFPDTPASRLRLSLT